MKTQECSKWDIFSTVSTLRLFINGTITCFLVGYLLTKVLPPHKLGILWSTELHKNINLLFFYAVILYSGFICWLRMKHRITFKIIIIPILLFFAFFIGCITNAWLFTPWIMSVPVLAACIHNSVYNMQWFNAFAVSLFVPVLFYIEELFFKWVRAGVSE